MAGRACLLLPGVWEYDNHNILVCGLSLSTLLLDPLKSLFDFVWAPSELEARNEKGELSTKWVLVTDGTIAFMRDELEYFLSTFATDLDCEIHVVYNEREDVLGACMSLDCVVRHLPMAHRSIGDFVDSLKCRRSISIFCESLAVGKFGMLTMLESWYQKKLKSSGYKNCYFLDLDSVRLSHDTVIDGNVVIEGNVHFGPGVRITGPATIRAFSYLEDCLIEQGSIIGPYACIRGSDDRSRHAKIAEHCHLGPFSQIHASHLGARSTVAHGAYLGDATVGERTTIGAGVITCNFDGLCRHRTAIGNGVFVGCHCSIVAPVKLGDEAFVASGSVIVSDVAAQEAAFGRARQENKEGYAREIRHHVEQQAKLRAIVCSQNPPRGKTSRTAEPTE